MSAFEASRFLAAVAEASRGLPHAQRTLFLAICAKWDPETGISGRRVRHSYQSLREILEVSESPGRPTEKATKHRVRSLLRALHRDGLIRRIGDLVFEVPALAQEKSVQKRLTAISTANLTAEERVKNGATAGNFNGENHSFDRHFDRYFDHTSYDDDISGAVIHLSEYTQGGQPNDDCAAFFVSQGFSRKQVAEAHSLFDEWSARGATLDDIKRVVALVNNRLERMGNDMPVSPRYYDREIKRRMSSEDRDRSDAGAGPGGGDEIDAALGGPLH